MRLLARQFEFVFPRPALIMGIVNVTPDSFSDGGRFLDPDNAVAHALRLVAEGAEMLDVGGESTRPGATPVTEAEELRRVMPVIAALARNVRVPISIDTQKLVVARAALEAGASVINDIAANRSDEAMWKLAAEFRAGYVAMHMQGTPQTMQLQPVYQDVIHEVAAFFEQRLERIQQAGVHIEQIVLDPGLGFGKTLEHNLELLRRWNTFTRFRRPLLLGVSRKSFLGRMCGGSLAANERLPAALACTCWAAGQGMQLVRTHDVSPTLKAVRATEVLLRKNE